MTQNSDNVVVENDTASSVRAELNEILEDITTLHAGVAEPSTTYANMLWYDTSNDTLKMRNEIGDGWISVGYINQASDVFSIFDGTNLVNTSGVTTGVLASRDISYWEGGTDTTESLVSPAKVKAAIDENPSGIGVGQTWQTVSRSAGTSYQNTTGRPIMVAYMNANTVSYEPQVSTDNSSWVAVGSGDNSGGAQVPQQFIVPNQHYYRINNASAGVKIWSELR